MSRAGPVAVILGMLATAAVPRGAVPDGGAAPPKLFRLSADAAFPVRRSPWVDDRFALDKLAPYFDVGPLAEAKAAFDQGLYPQALERIRRAASDVLLHPELAAPARYLRALALMRVGIGEEAAREFLALVTVYPDLRDRCQFSAAVALEESNHPKAAADAYARVAPESPLYREALLGQARALAAAGEGSGALAALAPLTKLAPPVSGNGRDFGAEALWASADLEERLGRRRDAARDYRAVWLEHPVYRAAADARTRGEALARGLAHFIPPTALQLTESAEILLAAHRLAAAQAAFAAEAAHVSFGAAPSELACRLRFDLGKVLRMERKHGEAIAALRPVVDRCRAYPELRARALYVLGSSASIVQPELGVQVYEQLAKEYPRSSFADDALFYEADLQGTRLDDAAKATATLERLVATYPHGDFTVEALFRLFWLARAAGKASAGVSSLEAIVDRLQSEHSAMRMEPLLRARYWLAETLASEADVKARANGLTRLADLAREEPFTYYGALALGRLPSARVAPPPLVTDPTDLALHAGTLIADVNFRAGVELLRLGFPNAAMQELESVDRKLLSGPTGTAEPLLLLALCLDRAGDHQLAHAIAKSTLALPEAGATSKEQALLWRIAYPLAFRPDIERWAQGAGVPADLMQALMREESALDPTVISGAGAVGLTQLMPSTANRIARRLGLPRVTLTTLGDPSLNIRIGCAYVSDLLRRYGRNPALALAAYNAGEGAVDRWLDQHGRESLDAFVEEIPIAETRGYVKRVLATYATYRYLYGSGPERLSRFDERLAAAF
ncbi:MAG TPA: transglycosylase SLT domain-containing protein [Myxococcales bacterium]|nr:transglycosylase SLT domain-containing protein [Myxococcales bacterium]